MDRPEFDYVDAIAQHSDGLATAARDNLDADVEGCPGWTVADLVHHLTTTHWFWATIVEERLSAQPDEVRRPAVASREHLIASFQAGAERLTRVLRGADGRDRVYTWTPKQQDVAFVTRHQVQEAAIHHWDAVRAAGGTLAIETPVAVDSITEFLTFSVSSDADPADPPRPALDGRFTMRCSDSNASWTVGDGQTPGTVTYELDPNPDVPAITATASELLLWLYHRVDLNTASVPSDLIERFQALCFTD
ncbi:MAG: maleylpyruvate isomerase family mycothiol-dependent enzyme [Candidatus Dormibacteria bacterium]